MRSFRGCRGCKSAKRRCTEEKPICSACAKAGRECQVLILLTDGIADRVVVRHRLIISILYI